MFSKIDAKHYFLSLWTLRWRRTHRSNRIGRGVSLLAYLLGCLVLTSPCLAQNGKENARCRAWSRGCLAINADALYWKAYGGDFPLGLLIRETNADQVFINPDFNWGFRIGGRYLLCRSRYFARAHFTWFENRYTTDTRVTEPDLKAESHQMGRSCEDFALKAKALLQYYTIDFLVGSELLFGHCHYLSLFAGVRWLRLQTTTSSFAQRLPDMTVTSDERISQHFAGTGPELGIEVRYQICGSLSVFVVATGTAAAGRQPTHTIIQLSSVPTANVIQRTTIIVPVVEGQLGLRYGLRLCGHTIDLTAAFEYHTHFEILNIGDLIAAEGARRSISFAGLALGAGMTY